MKRSSLFRLSALQFALIAGFAHADANDASQSTYLPTVNVNAEATSSKPIENWHEWSKHTATDLKGVLSDQVGVGFGGGNGLSQWITIRGMGQDQIDYVVDGISNDATIFHHQGRFSLDPALVKVINIEKGTGSASSGIGATSGKIEAVTVDATDLLREGQNIGFRVNAGISSNKGHNAGFAVYGRQSGFDGILIGNWVNDGNYKSGDGNTIANSALGNRNFLGKVAYNFNQNHRLELSHRHEEQYGMRNLREEFINFSGNDASYAHRTTETTNLLYKGQNIGFISKVDANIYYSKFRQDKAGNPTTHFKDSNSARLTTTGGNINLTSNIGEHRLKYGLNHRHEKGESSLAQFNGQSKTDIGLYVEGIWSFNPITLTTGLRYDHFKLNGGNNSASGHNFNPSIGVIWDATDNLAFNASYHIASRSPRMREVLIGSGPMALADNLKAERAHNAEIGFNWNHQGLGLSGSLFHQKIYNLQRISTINGIYTTYNQGTLKNYGYELHASYRWKGLTARMGVSHSKPTVDGAIVDNRTIAMPMGRQWMTSLSYRFEPAHLEIGWRGRYAQKTQHPDKDRSGKPITATRSGYGVHDIYANWQPTGKDNLNVNFAINNIGNKLYYNQSQRANVGLLERGRDIRLGVNYRF